MRQAMIMMIRKKHGHAPRKQLMEEEGRGVMDGERWGRGDRHRMNVWKPALGNQKQLYRFGTVVRTRVARSPSKNLCRVVHQARSIIWTNYVSAREMLSDLRRDSEYVVGASAFCACTFTRTYIAIYAFRDAKTRMKIILSVIVPSLKVGCT